MTDNEAFEAFIKTLYDKLEKAFEFFEQNYNADCRHCDNEECKLEHFCGYLSCYLASQKGMGAIDILEHTIRDIKTDYLNSQRESDGECTMFYV